MKNNTTEGRIVVGIDVGTYKIVTLIAKVDEYVNILGVSEVKSGGIRKGQVVDIEEAVHAINSSIESAERMAGYSVSRVFASIGGNQIDSQNSRGVVAVSTPQGEISANDLSRVIDAAKAISLPSTREIIHVLPRNYIVDGQEGIKDPIGMSGVRLEVDTHIITANSIAVRNLDKAFSEVGVDVTSFVFNGYASSLSVLSDTERELGVVLVDIGAGTTDISIYTEGSVAYSAVLAIGARHITNDLAIGLRISLESAEKIKLFLSQQSQRRILRPDDDEKAKEPKPSDEIDLSSLNLPEEVRKVSYKTLVDGIIRPRMNEIFTMVGIEIKKSGYGGQTPAGLVITGGGAMTVGIKDAAKRMLAMPVRVGMPTDLKGIVDEVQNPAYASAVGLLLYGAKNDGGSSSSGFGFSMPKMPGGSNKFIKKLIDFISSFIP
ncbi:MAG TPA: cell division protein FtsA [Patescibacteria group bacterium]|nr:cell division protein FtsA [Patescibacteria group bacterium]